MLLLLSLACAPESAPVCSPYSGIVSEGRAFTYSAFDGDNVWTEQVTSISEAGDVEVKSEASTEHYQCDAEGLWQTDLIVESELGTERWDFEPRMLVVPAGLAVGDAWTSERAEAYTGPNAETSMRSSSTQYEVTGEVEITVEAGTFTALEIASLGEDAEHDLLYRDGDKGLILTNTYQFVGVVED